MQHTMTNGDHAGWQWDHSYARLPAMFYESTHPCPVADPKLVVMNTQLAAALGLDADVLGRADAVELFAGNRLPEKAEPIAQAYAGHQYGHFTGLGDGRAILLGEHLGPDGRRWDIQLKGSGRTPFSRGGDGRAALGPMLREYLISEAMAALGIPTTRSLAVVATGEEVMRDGPLPGAVLTRVAASHIRVGTFQWAAAHEDVGALRALLRHTAARHFPELDPDDARGFLAAAQERQAALVVEWMRVGFVHGVMNTDNVALSGETIDYGPCAFLDAYDPDAVFSSIDRGGRYAFANQPAITRWNLARLAETLLPLLDDDRGRAVDFANEVLAGFERIFQSRWLAMMRAKTGLLTEEAGDAALIQELLDAMHAAGADYTNTFRMLSETGEPPPHEERFREWHARWQGRLARQRLPPAEVSRAMCAANPAVIPRNHKVESALTAAATGDLAEFQHLLEVLTRPYEEPADDAFAQPPPDGTPKHVTFCGT
jgi:serine/tyrosine/threonine adenylyltransferase